MPTMPIMLVSAAVLGVLFFLHCAVVGSAALLVVRGQRLDTDDRPTDVFFSVCLGMLVNMLGLFALGVVGRFHLAAVAWMALVFLAVAIVALARVRRHAPIKVRAKLSRLGMATLASLSLLCVMASLHPPGHWDDTMYQLPLARHYVQHEAIMLNEYLRFPLFPQNMNLLFAVGLMLGDAFLHVDSAGGSIQSQAASGLWHFGAPEVYAQLFATLPLFVIAVGLWAASRRYMNSGIPGLLGGLTLFMIQPVKGTLGFAYVDNGLALFCFAATLAVAALVDRTPAMLAPASSESRPGTTEEREGRGIAQGSATQYAMLAGLFAGAACGIKYFGIPYAAMIGVILIVVTYRRSGGIPPTIRAAAAYTVALVVGGAGWYVRSYLIAGDPVHPAGGPIFGYFLWDAGDLAWQHAEQGLYGTARNPLMLPVALEEAGVLLWLPAIAGVLIPRQPAAIRVMQAAFISYLLFWFFATQVPRYLAPVYGVAGLLSFHPLYWVIQRWRARRWPTRMRPAWPALAVLALSLAYTAERGAKYGREYRSAEQVLATNHGYTLYQQANAHINEFGARLVQIGFEDGVYFFKGTVIGDWFGPGRYRTLLDCARLPCALSESKALARTLRHHDADMLLISRQAVTNLDDKALEADGWTLLATNANGSLFAPPMAGRRQR